MVQVKKNQPTLYSELSRVAREQVPLDNATDKEKDHGRHSLWEVEVYDVSESPKAKEWKNLSRFILVRKWTTIKGKESYGERFYISDLENSSAEYFHKGIRGHWGIENKLHWVKDVIHGEDGNAIKKGNGPVNASILSSITLNIHRKDGNDSITYSQIKYGAKVKSLFELLQNI